MFLLLITSISAQPRTIEDKLINYIFNLFLIHMMAVFLIYLQISFNSGHKRHVHVVKLAHDELEDAA